MNRRDRPRVIANFAMTADGKVSTRAHTPAAFTSPRDKRRLLEIRALGDAILVGRNTVATDTMSMRIRDRALRASRRAKGLPAEPLRVIVSARGNLDPAWKVFRSPGARRIVFSTRQMPGATRRAILPLCELHLFDAASLPIAEVLSILRRDHDVRTLVCEGGPTLFRSLVEIGALDTLHLTVAPLIFGGRDAPTLTGTHPDFLASIRHFRLESLRTHGGECYLRYRAIRQ
ncbi:MAG: RibD family protein [Terrimicrobiaceae bacterium]|nr:RibD family protein [Terrimicrobiaceae bacterium]